MILRPAGSAARKLESVVDGGGLYIVENDPLESLLFDRNLVEVPFRDACLDASRMFIRHVADEIPWSRTSELVILSKGLLYQLSDAVRDEAGRNLPVNLIATSRLDVSRADATIDISYRSFDAGGTTLLIADTIASGATVVAALQEYTKYHNLEQIYVFSYAGSRPGAERISRYCRENGVAVTFLFGLAVFGLGENGFDLSFLHPDTIAAPQYRARADRQFAGRPVSAVGWDFGSQVMAPGKYRALCWIEAEKWGLHGAPCLAREQRPADLSQVARETKAYADIAARLPMMPRAVRSG